MLKEEIIALINKDDMREYLTEKISYIKEDVLNTLSYKHNIEEISNFIEKTIIQIQNTK